MGPFEGSRVSVKRVWMIFRACSLCRSLGRSGRSSTIDLAVKISQLEELFPSSVVFNTSGVCDVSMARAEPYHRREFWVATTWSSMACKVAKYCTVAQTE